MRNYTISQLVFSLRKEYLELETRLKLLKRCMSVNSNLIKDYKFKLDDNQKRILLIFEENKILLDLVLKKLKIFERNNNIFDVTNNLKQYYYINNRVVGILSNLERIKNEINKILESEFVNNISFNLEEDMRSLLIETDGITLLTQDSINLNYNSDKDELSLKNKNGYLNKKDIYDILNLSLSEEYFNDYYRRILDNYEDKDIVIEEDFNNNDVSLQIVEDPKKIILKKK